MIILIIITVCAILIVGWSFYVDIKEYNKIHRKSISFMEALNLTGLPVVSFKCGDKILNFLLDTGSTDSVIDKNVLDKIKYKKEEGSTLYFGIESSDIKSNICTIELSYKDQLFTDSFAIADLKKTFDKLKGLTGVQLNGLIGSSFFNKYRYVIDFDQLIAYSKKK